LMPSERPVKARCSWKESTLRSLARTLKCLKLTGSMTMLPRWYKRSRLKPTALSKQLRKLTSFCIKWNLSSVAEILSGAKFSLARFQRSIWMRKVSRPRKFNTTDLWSNTMFMRNRLSKVLKHIRSSMIPMLLSLKILIPQEMREHRLSKISFAIYSFLNTQMKKLTS
jgi:hypothetical protein